MSTQAGHRIRYFHIPFFASVMGMTGLTLSWQKAHEVLGLPLIISQVLLGLVLLQFAWVSLSYLLKILRYPDNVREELHHPIKISFFPAFSISLILISMALLEVHRTASMLVWISGASLHLILTLYVLNQWMHQTHFKVQHSTPAWFIPVVGNILVPIAGVQHGFAEVAWLYFAIGLLFWIVLKVLVFNRIMFHEPLPVKMLPTLFIFIAPPAVGFLAYLQLNGNELNDFARLLYFSAFFITLLLLTQFQRFLNLDFYLSWWAYSFPLAAFTIATQVYYQHTGLAFFQGLAYLMLAVTTVIISLLAVKTLKVVISGRIFHPD